MVYLSCARTTRLFIHLPLDHASWNSRVKNSFPLGLFKLCLDHFSKIRPSLLFYYTEFPLTHRYMLYTIKSLKIKFHVSGISSSDMT